MQQTHTCRFCGESEWERDGKLVKYGVRHYAHHACYLENKSLDDLPGWKIGQFPMKLLEQHGYGFEETSKLIDSKPF